jgi:hypothetical protein
MFDEEILRNGKVIANVMFSRQMDRPIKGPTDGRTKRSLCHFYERATQKKMNMRINPLLRRYTAIALANSIDPDQLAHPCCSPLDSLGFFMTKM